MAVAGGEFSWAQWGFHDGIRREGTRGRSNAAHSARDLLLPVRSRPQTGEVLRRSARGRRA
jgi:hypothetical protein